jgi:hypothetical protein
VRGDGCGTRYGRYGLHAIWSVAVDDVTVPRRRGPNRAVPWRWDGPVSVLRLPLDVHDPHVRRHVERLYAAGYAVRRAVQRDARSRVAAYRAAHHERHRAGPAVRDRLGLTRTGLEQAAYRHVDHGPHLRRHLTKALAMHLADGVWQGVERHLFPDTSGRRHGPPKVGGWWDFTRIPGRARSHTRPRKWETFRLAGTLPGHHSTYQQAGVLRQPRRMPAVTPAAGGRPARSWWEHDGPFAVLLTGTGGGDLVLPVRLPQGPARRPVLEHYLGDPEPTAPTGTQPVCGRGGRSAAPATPTGVAGAGVLGEVPVRADTMPPQAAVGRCPRQPRMSHARHHRTGPRRNDEAHTPDCDITPHHRGHEPGLSEDHRCR